jgi:hypothetical protein
LNKLDYQEQFDFAKNLIGQKITKVEYYLEQSDSNFTEQPNKYGHSLLNGINISTDNLTFTLRNGFCENHGLKMQKGKISEHEFIEEQKSPRRVNWKILNEKIVECKIYWMKIPWHDSTGFYPQEIKLETDNNSVIISSVEILNGELDELFTDEILVVENQNSIKELSLGEYGIEDNGRIFFENAKQIAEKTGYNNGYN